MKIKMIIFLFVTGFYLLAGFGSAQAAAQVYKIQRVAADDSLNMRTTAGVKGGVVATIPFNGTGVVATGTEQKLGSSTWVEIRWSGKSGWVNKYYLAEDKQAAPAQADAAVSAQPVATVAAAQGSGSVATPAQPEALAQYGQPAAPAGSGGSSIFMRCGGTEPFWSMHVRESLLVVKIMDGPEYTTPVEFRKQSENNTSIAVVAGRKGGKGTLTAAFLQKVDACSDGMSDKNYPYSMTAMLDGARAVSGCCEMSGGQ